MAAGDVVSDYSDDLAADAYMSIQPAAGVEWVIHNIYCGATCEVYWSNGSKEIPIFSATGAAWISGMFSHCTNGKYLKVKNKSGGASDFGYDGIITKQG